MKEPITIEYTTTQRDTANVLAFLLDEGSEASKQYIAHYRKNGLRVRMPILFVVYFLCIAVLASLMYWIVGIGIEAVFGHALRYNFLWFALISALSSLVVIYIQFRDFPRGEIKSHQKQSYKWINNLGIHFQTSFETDCVKWRGNGGRLVTVEYSAVTKVWLLEDYFIFLTCKSYMAIPTKVFKPYLVSITEILNAHGIDVQVIQS